MLLDRSFILPRHFCTLLMNVPWRYCSQLQICNALIPIKVLRPTVKCCQNCMGSAVCVNSSWLCKSLVPFQMQDKKKEKTPSTDQEKKKKEEKTFPVYLSLGFLIYYALIWLYAKDVVTRTLTGLCCNKTLATQNIQTYSELWTMVRPCS